MQTTLYYFSATGNTLALARKIALGLGETELINIASVINQQEITPTTTQIGILFPVYFFGSPLIILDFIKKLKIKPLSYVFAVVSYGGMLVNSLFQFKKIFEADGKVLQASFAVRMPGNYMPLYDVFSVKKQQALFQKADKKIKQVILPCIKNQKNYGPDRNFRLLGHLFSNYLRSKTEPHIHKFDKNFWINEECNQCGICEKVCPVNNIILREGKPVWQNHCEQCLACLHWCPKKAVQHGKRSEKHGRYHHPDIQLNEIIIMN